MVPRQISLVSVSDFFAWERTCKSGSPAVVLCVCKGQMEQRMCDIAPMTSGSTPTHLYRLLYINIYRILLCHCCTAEMESHLHIFSVFAISTFTLLAALPGWTCSFRVSSVSRPASLWDDRKQNGAHCAHVESTHEGICYRWKDVTHTQRQRSESPAVTPTEDVFFKYFFISNPGGVYVPCIYACAR